MLEGDADIDALSGNEFMSGSEALCQTDEAGKDCVGGYMISNLARHVVCSLP